MINKERKIEKITIHLVTALKKNDYVNFEGKEGAILEKMKGVIVANMAEEEQIDREVKKVMETYSSQIDKGEVDSRKMYGMIKSKLAKEKGFIL